MDTSQTVFVATYVKVRGNRSPPDVYALCYSPEKANALRHMAFVMMDYVYKKPFSEKTGISAEIFDDLEDAGGVSGQILTFEAEGETVEQGCKLDACRVEGEEERFIAYHYSEKTETGDRDLLGFFSVEETRSTIYDSLRRTTAADHAFERMCEPVPPPI